jgi:hypothetical protein
MNIWIGDPSEQMRKYNDLTISVIITILGHGAASGNSLRTANPSYD